MSEIKDIVGNVKSSLKYPPTDYFCCWNCKSYSRQSLFCTNLNEKKEGWNYHCGNIILVKKPVKIEKAEEKSKKQEKQNEKTILKVKEGYIRIDNYIENIRDFYNKQPFFYNKNNIFWIWDDTLKKYSIVDDTDLHNFLDLILGMDGQTISSHTKSNYLEAFKRVGRRNEPKEAPSKWIQFKGKAFSLDSGNIYDVTPEYFFTNPIPYDIGNTEDTPVMDRLFEEWVGKEYVETLYEIIAYCCYREYPLHKIFCFVGSGRNGKTQFQKVLQKFLGKENITSTELDQLMDSRFESFKLYRKLLCVLGETNFGTLSKTSLLKKLTGQDLIGFEMKNKNPFDDYNYSKMIINSNSLPHSDDTSDGFYRRWMIIDFPNEFNEGKDIYKIIPKAEYNNLARKVYNMLPKLLEDGKFTKEGSIEERKRKYIESSNPLPIFIKEYCIKNEAGFCSYSELYTAYVFYLKKRKKRRVKGTEFRIQLTDEGHFVEKTNKVIGQDNYGSNIFKSANWVDGLELKYDWKEL